MFRRRLQAMADPGGLCISDIAMQQVRGKVDVAFVFDVSGSMDGSRMASLKDAAKTAVRQLIPDNPATGHEPLQILCKLSLA